MDLSVIIPAHNPNPERLHRTLSALKAQTLPFERWETVLVDNASSPPLEESAFAGSAPPNLRLVRESRLGLTSARRRGLAEVRSPVCVLVDDDNVLAPSYLEQVLRLFQAYPKVGAFGGKSVPEFERPPLAWQREFFGLLALRDLGDKPVFARGLESDGKGTRRYPIEAAPIGAGMALRREAVEPWLADSSALAFSDRRGTDLASSGDNDLVLAVLGQGWEVAYFPELVLTHLIPASRLDADYLGRLNRGIQKSWVQVLARHQASPWPPIPTWTLPLRKTKAWFVHRAWASPAGRTRWLGACGHFEGRVGHKELS